MTGTLRHLTGTRAEPPRLASYPPHPSASAELASEHVAARAAGRHYLSPWRPLPWLPFPPLPGEAGPRRRLLPPFRLFLTVWLWRELARGAAF